MKALIKFALLTVVLTASYTGVHAQKLFFVVAHGQYSSPVQNTFKANFNYGLGGEAGVGIGPGKTKVMGTIGYHFFNARSGHEASDLTVVPMKLGLRRYILPLIFVHADAGVAKIKAKGADGRTSGFTADIGAGVKLGPMDLGVAYDGFQYEGAFRSFVAFKAGWRLGL
jgi:hypothetical protein